MKAYSLPACFLCAAFLSFCVLSLTNSFSEQNRSNSQLAKVNDSFTLAMHFPKYDSDHAELINLIEYSPKALKTLIVADAFAILKTPDLDRRDGNKAVLQYRSDTCILNLYVEADQSGFVEASLIKSFAMTSREPLKTDEKGQEKLIAKQIDLKSDQSNCFRSIMDTRPDSDKPLKFAKTSL